MSVARVCNVLAGLCAIYEVVEISGLLTVFGVFVPFPVHGAISLLFVLTLVFLRYNRGHDNEGGAPGIKAQVRWYDWLGLLLGWVGAGFVALFYSSKVIKYSLYGYLDVAGEVLAVCLGLSLLIAVRRLTGWVLPILIVVFLLFTGFQSWLPGVLNGPDYGFDRLTYAIYVGTSGVFGLPLQVAATILIVFLLFGQMLQSAGAGKWFMEIAMALTGWSRGGPAKACVVASGLLGSISGSPSGNAATIGVITIPLMKKVGFTDTFAGAVEATASTGGMVLPPVMGTVAFIMASWLNISYAQVARAAAIPAILYYVILFMSVHFNASRRGIPALPRAELPRFWPALREGWFFLPPIFALFYFLVIKALPPEVAGLYALPFMVVFSFFNKDRSGWLTPRRLWQAGAAAVRGWLVIATVTGTVGLLIGSLDLSGLGIKFSDFIIQLGHGSLIFTLLLTGLASLILGMGLDATPAYMTLAILTAPALVKLGLTPVQAHLYVIFWGLASFLTPPVCLAVYVACSISGSKVWATGWQAMRLGAAAFLVSIAFALNNALLLNGAAWDVALSVITALLGTVCIAACFEGWSFRPLNWPQRMILFVAGVLWIGPGVFTALVALVLVLGVLSWQWYQRVQSKQDVSVTA